MSPRRDKNQRDRRFRPDKGRQETQPRRLEKRPEQARDTWLYGRHAVLAAVANPARRCRRLVLTSEAMAQTAEALRTALKTTRDERLSPEILPRAKIDHLLPEGATHQGIALLADPLPETAIEDVCRRLAETPRARVVVLDQATDPRNVGAVLRAAAAFGAEAVIIQDRHAPPTGGALAKAASGALEAVALVRVVNLARALEFLKKAGFWCVGLDASAQSLLADTDLSGKVALVLGSEGEGLRRLTRDSCDLLAKIPMAQGWESLNLATAAAIALYETFARSAGKP